MDIFEFFEMYNEVAIAFSGGVDSAYLLYEAIENGALVKAYYVKSAFQPDFELEDAKKIAEQLHADLEILEVDVLSEPSITANPENRCYHCKKHMFKQILKAAQRDGFSVVLDGTNASDKGSERPGMRVLHELDIQSPLRDADLTKEDVRRLSKEAGLFTWNKPAYSCLATRIPTGTAITAEALRKTELAEQYLSSLGFSDFRVRLIASASDTESGTANDIAKIQIPASQMELLHTHREEILAELSKYYTSVVLDLEVRHES